jgi:hypothetical protein
MPLHAVPSHTGPGQNRGCPTQANLTMSALLREQQGRLAPSLLPSAAIGLPRHTAPSPNTPCPTMPDHAKTALLRKQQGERRPSVLPSATVTSPDPALPCPAEPGPTRPRPAVPRHVYSLKESSREGLRPPCCRLQLLPYYARLSRTAHCHAVTHLTEACLIYSPKRATGRA